MGIGDAFSEFAVWLYGVINDVIAWVLGFGEYLSAWAIDQTLSAVASVFEAIPVPQAFAEVGGAWSGIVTTAGFFLAPWHVGEGLTMFFSALGLRFLIRRLPFVG